MLTWSLPWFVEFMVYPLWSFTFLTVSHHKSSRGFPVPKALSMVLFKGVSAVSEQHYLCDFDLGLFWEAFVFEPYVWSQIPPCNLGAFLWTNGRDWSFVPSLIYGRCNNKELSNWMGRISEDKMADCLHSCARCLHDWLDGVHGPVLWGEGQGEKNSATFLPSPELVSNEENIEMPQTDIASNCQCDAASGLARAAVHYDRHATVRPSPEFEGE